MYQEIDVVELIRALRINRLMTSVVFGDSQQQNLVPYFKWYEADEHYIKTDPFWLEEDGCLRNLPPINEEQITELKSNDNNSFVD
mmetsp:Transcript_6509/g.4631  ORF Transcript_6509/g.4631 Transcript_6509/m.4631 type:complete len:85 (-) Transcript_6509:72-326(-)